MSNRQSAARSNLETESGWSVTAERVECAPAYRYHPLQIRNLAGSFVFMELRGRNNSLPSFENTPCICAWLPRGENLSVTRKTCRPGSPMAGMSNTSLVDEAAAGRAWKSDYVRPRPYSHLNAGQFSLTHMLAIVCVMFVCPAYSSELREQCTEAEKRGIAFLAVNQKESGGFTSYEWRTAMPDNKRKIGTPFTVSQVVYSLTFCNDNSTARAVRERAAGWLVSQREEPGLWRYRGRADLLPFDADDTAMAWAALQREGQPIPREALDALRADRNEAGLFNTWMGDPSTWRTNIDSRDPDAVVNLNAL